MKIVILIKFLTRHGIVSFACASVDFIIFYLIYSVSGLAIFLAYLIGFLCSASVGFWGHSVFTFRVGFNSGRNLGFFLLQLILSFVLGYVTLILFIQAGIMVEYSKIFQLFCTFFFNVIFGKLISFRPIN